MGLASQAYGLGHLAKGIHGYYSDKLLAESCRKRIRRCCLPSMEAFLCGSFRSRSNNAMARPVFRENACCGVTDTGFSRSTGNDGEVIL